MRKLLFALFALIVLSSHDMFLKLDSYFLEPNSEATIQLYNGTFDESDNTIDRDRMIDVSIVANGTRTAVDSNQWTERGNTTILDFTTGESGTYVAGVSTRARNIEMEAEAFNDYLAHDGVVDMLDKREREGMLDRDAVEKYSKHVKTIFQVGDKRSDDWRTPLGYPIEFMPLSNPYDLHSGDRLRVQLLLRGRPLADQLVIVDSDGGGDHGHDGTADHDHDHHGANQLRTDADGTLAVEIINDGTWHLRTIHMVDTEEAGLTHESNWTTLTFAVDHGQPHSHAHGAGHAHTHDHEGGIPGYAYWVGSFLLLGGLYFWFNRK